MLDLKSEKIEVKIDGEVHSLDLCSTVMAKNMFKKMREINGESSPDKLIDLQIDLLKKCGATDEFIEKLQLPHFGAICEAVLGAKKN